MASVQKRKWKGPNGEPKEAWMVRYFDGQGKQRGKTFARKKEADAFRQKVERELFEDKHIADTATVKVSDLIDEYILHCEQRHRDGRKMSLAHITTLRQQFKNHIRPGLGNYKLTELDFVTVERWGSRMLREKKLAPLTVRNILYMLRVAIDFAIRRGWVKTNVVRDVMVEFRGMKQEKIRLFTKGDINKLLAALETRAPRQSERAWMLIRCYAHLALFCGLRWGEITALKVEHVLFDEGIIEVRYSMDRADNLKAPKTKAGIRNVPMPGVVADGLREWLKRHYIDNERGLLFRTRYVAGPGPRKPGPAKFGCLHDGKMTSTNFHSGHWQPLLEKAGLGPDREGRNLHFHALRHFCASMMIQTGVPLTDAAELLGHSSYDMTLQVYAHAIMGTNKRAAILEDIARELAHDQVSKVIALPKPQARKPVGTGKARQAMRAYGK